MSERSGKKKGSKHPSTDEMEWNNRVHEKDDILMGYLSPIETSVMTFQNVLVWENPRHSAVLFVVVHILFWLATTVRVYYVIGISGTIIVAVDMWKNHIWPEIRVPIPPGEDTEDWTPVHPKLLSVPEICHWLARWWVYAADTVHTAISLRKTNHPKFFLYAIIILSCTAAVGCYIPGLLIAYITVLFCLLVPCVLYHDGWHQIQVVMQPLISAIEKKLNIKRKRKGMGKQRHGAEPAVKEVNQSDSDSEELQEFVPQLEDPKIQMTLARAESESEDEEEFSPGLLTPPHIPSQGTSREHSDIEDSLATSTDDLGSLVADLRDIPSYDDTLDGTDTIDDRNDLSNDETSRLTQEVDEAIAEDDDHKDVSSGEGDREAIEFVASHFSQFSEEDDSDELEQTLSVMEPEEDIIKELSENMSEFPDVDEDSTEPTPTQAMMASGVQILTSHGQALVSHGQALVSAIGSTNVTGLVASTVAGLSTIRETVSSVVHTPQAASGDATMSDSIDSKQLESEFEFLNEEELAQNDDDAKVDSSTK